MAVCWLTWPSVLVRFMAAAAPFLFVGAGPTVAMRTSPFTGCFVSLVTKLRETPVPLRLQGS